MRFVLELEDGAAPGHPHLPADVPNQLRGILATSQPHPACPALGAVGTANYDTHQLYPRGQALSKKDANQVVAVWRWGFQVVRVRLM